MIRWLGRFAVSIFGGAVLVGTAWWAVGHSELERRVAELEAERAELKRVIGRLKNERRVAHLMVGTQHKADDGRVADTTVEFVAFDAEGRPSPPRSFTIAGDVCYVDGLVVRFLDSYVEKGAALQGHSLHLFRRIFGESQAPADGFPLDEEGGIPTFYQVESEAGRFERKLWQRFWDYARNPRLAAEQGVRLAQGEAVYQRVEPGQLWQISTRADGGLEMKLVPLDPLVARQLSGSSANPAAPAARPR
jgi:hypothetical protein